MTQSLTTVSPSSASSVVDRLSEPQTAAALNTLLDHADLLAVTVVALDGFIGRSEVIGEALISGFDDLRDLADAKRATGLDVGAIAGSLTQLAETLPKITGPLARIASSGLLDTVADNADLVALGLQSTSDFLARGDEFVESVAAGVNELREVAANTAVPVADPGQVLASLAQLSSLLPKLTPVITHVVDSGMVDTVLNSTIASPEVVDQISRMGNGLAAAAQQQVANPQKAPGALGMLRLLKDPDINRGAGFFIAALKAVGKELGEMNAELSNAPDARKTQ